MSLENIIGSRSKISILDVLFSDPDRGYTLWKLSKDSGVPYSVVHRDIIHLKDTDFIAVERKANKCIVMLNKEHEMFSRIRNLFAGSAAAPVKLFKSKEALIIVHHNADPDALGSAVALARGLSQGGMKCEIVAPDGISRQSKAVLQKYPYPVSETISSYPDLVFVLDTSSYSQIGNISIPASSKVVVIDHHARGAIAKRADMKLIDSSAHSTGVLVYDLFVRSGIRITSEIAFFLLVAIVADTAFLRLVDSRDLRIVSILMENASLDDVISTLSVKIELSQRIAMSKAVVRSKIYQVGRLIVVFSRAGSFESAIARSMINSFADIAIIENVKDNNVRISARARSHLAGTINLVSLLKPIRPVIRGDAGGHVTAASANGSDSSRISDVRRILLDGISLKLKARPKQI